MKLPLAKNTNIIVQTVGRELLVYDLITHKAYSLNETSVKVYNACDGKTTFDDLKHQYKFTDEIIFLALDVLNKEGLLVESDYASPLAGLSRREAVKKVGLASIVALPLISALVVPTAAQTSSQATCNPCTVSLPAGTTAGNPFPGGPNMGLNISGCVSGCTNCRCTILWVD